MTPLHEHTHLSLIIDAQGPALLAGYDCEADVSLEAFGNTPEMVQREYSIYNNQSIFVTVADDTGKVWGVCRVIAPGPAGLKTINDLQREPWNLEGLRVANAANLDLTSTCDYATLGVRSDAGARRFMIAIALFHGVALVTRKLKVQSVVAQLDMRTRRLLSTVDYNFSFLPGAFAGYHLGSESTAPVFGHVAMLERTQRRLNPEAHRLMTMGIGIEGITLQQSTDFTIGSPEVIVKSPEQIREEGTQNEAKITGKIPLAG